MKKILTLFFTSLIVLLMFVGPGNVAFAHEGDGCGCIVEPVFGAEKNKIVSNLLKSDEFKIVKKENINNGLKWTGVKKVEVIYNITHDVMMVGVPFINKDGTVLMEVFFDGVYMDPDLIPQSEEDHIE
ncbi:hypothetical protein ACN6MT_17910 [Neobacillus niacini]|uniref:hypothetical protein n=1 Tax=Neobacillus niacini TaxID=86668 RepID=UPI003B019297